MDAYTSEASVVELEALLEELDAFDGLPAREPEAPVETPGDAEEGL
jgi:hypothetical protein